jgi:dTDP-4-dehydrorhamnose 3,5-epimerase
MSQIKVETTGLKGVLAITPPTNFEDFRGSYVETYNRELFHAAGITQDFIQDDISTSSRGVLRGIHGDGKTWKLISCLYGTFYFVVVNNDPESDEYKKSITLTLSDRNRLQILVPPKFGNGHLVLSHEAIFHYKQTTTYDRASQFTIKWDDPDYGIWWPTTSPILSQRDSV